MQGWEFGGTVRPWRERVAPQAVGLPTGSRRRAAGLRREELAGLAGISVDYLTRLEQGRATSPSAQVVEALARSLRLSDAERDLLYGLAGLSAPGLGVVSTRVTSSVQRLLEAARLVADLRLTATRYPSDTRLSRLVTELRAQSPRFVELWESTADLAPPEQSRHKVIDHPLVGPTALDCDTLVVAGDDLRIMVYNAEPTTADAERLALAVILGTQALID